MPNEQAKCVTDEELKDEFRLSIAIDLIGLLENLLEHNDITIPNKNREGEEMEARIYGDDYYNLENDIIEMLKNRKII